MSGRHSIRINSICFVAARLEDFNREVWVVDTLRHPVSGPISFHQKWSMHAATPIVDPSKMASYTNGFDISHFLSLVHQICPSCAGDRGVLAGSLEAPG